jgi:hypothetical protein
MTDAEKVISWFSGGADVKGLLRELPFETNMGLMWSCLLKISTEKNCTINEVFANSPVQVFCKADLFLLIANYVASLGPEDVY